MTVVSSFPPTYVMDIKSTKYTRVELLELLNYFFNSIKTTFEGYYERHVLPELDASKFWDDQR